MPRKKKNDSSPPESLAGESSAQDEMMSKDTTESKSAGEALEMLQAQLSECQVQLEEANKKAEEHRDGWQRALADYANMKRRAERDQAALQQTLLANTLRRYLEISDDLERALSNRPKESDTGRWFEGVELTYRKLMNFLEADGVSQIISEGQFFDPNLHEAISQEDHSDYESGMIIGVVQQGYRLGDRVLRPARVRVAR